MTTYGYARVSTKNQTLASQEAELTQAGAAKVYSEQISGARRDRPALQKLLKRLEAGDVVLVTRLDRLARSTRDLLNILDVIGKAGAGFGLAEFERELILARTNDGRIRAMKAGVKFGRPRALTGYQRQEAIQKLQEGATQADLARTYGVSQATISRLAPSPFVAAVA